MLRKRMLVLALLLLIVPAIAKAQTAGTMAEEGPGCREKCVTGVNSDGIPVGYGCITGAPNSGGNACYASVYMCMQVISECWGTMATQDGAIVSAEGGCRSPGLVTLVAPSVDEATIELAVAVSRLPATAQEWFP